jgi:hypothetical protein
VLPNPLASCYLRAAPHVSPYPSLTCAARATGTSVPRRARVPPPSAAHARRPRARSHRSPRPPLPLSHEPVRTSLTFPPLSTSRAATFAVQHEIRPPECTSPPPLTPPLPFVHPSTSKAAAAQRSWSHHCRGPHPSVSAATLALLVNWVIPHCLHLSPSAAGADRRRRGSPELHRRLKCRCHHPNLPPPPPRCRATLVRSRPFLHVQCAP